MLPPNGAIVYGLHDINGYDSLAPFAYRQFLAQGSGGEDVAPQWNGNIILAQNLAASTLDALNVRYIVAEEPQAVPDGRVVLRGDNWIVYERPAANVRRVSGCDFSPGCHRGVYQPESFRFGSFLSLSAVALLTFIWLIQRRSAHDATFKTRSYRI